MSQYGYEVVNALVTDLQPDAQVLNAMNAIESQRRLRAAAAEKAEAEKVVVVKAAEGEAEAKFLSGQGVARQRKAIVDGLKGVRQLPSRLLSKPKERGCCSAHRERCRIQRRSRRHITR